MGKPTCGYKQRIRFLSELRKQPALFEHVLQLADNAVVFIEFSEGCEFAKGKLGWDKIDGADLDIHVLPGTHITYIPDNNESAAKKLRELLGV